MFVLKMVWRETRASWARLLFFFLCVALGVSAIVLLRSVIQNVRITLTREARSLLGADVVVQTGRPLSEAQAATLQLALIDPRVLAHTTVVETQTMARARDGEGTGLVRLVELRAVEPAFPFYGSVDLEGGAPYSHALLAGHGALVQPALLADLGISVGDPLILGGEAFTIRGVVARDRVQQSAGIAFGPRVYVDQADLRATSILGYGSRATYATLVRLGDGGTGGWVERARGLFRGQIVSIRSWQTLEDRLGRSLTIAENYLSLVGFAVVVLGGIGVWSVTRVIVQQKIRSVAILKCVGASARQVLAIYVLQVVWLALCGSGLGLILAMAGATAIPARVLTALGVTSVGVTMSAAGQGMAVGVLVSILFALVPLMEVREVKPLLLLRADTVATARRRSAASVATAVGVGGLVVLVAIWQAGSLVAGAFVCAGLGVLALLLALAARVLIRLVQPLAQSRMFSLRHAVLGLGRPGNQTRVILLTVGLGVFFVLGVRALQSNLLAEFNEEVGQNWPDLVLIDIQRDQVDDVRALAAPYARQAPSLVPQLRARVTAVIGARVSLASIEAVREHGRLAREFSLTYRDGLAANEQVVAGAFWTGPLTAATTPDGVDTEVSIEEDVHNDVGVDVGDLIKFDLAGRTLMTRVTSIRKVTWSDEQNGGFVFVLRPGPAVARSPHTFMGFVQLTADPMARARLQRELVTREPNVTVIDVRDVLARIKDVVDNASLGVTIVGAVTLAGGVLILVGAVAMTRFQRIYDTAIYRALGAGTRVLATMVAIEYGLLGLLAGLLGAGGAFVLSWALARFLFDIDWRPVPGLLAAGVIITAVSVAIVGLSAGVDVLLRKPLGALRGEGR